MKFLITDESCDTYWLEYHDQFLITSIMVQGHCQGMRVEQIALKKVLIFGCRFVTVFHVLFFSPPRFLNVYRIFCETCNMGSALMCLLLKEYVGTEAYYAK